jgi:hypothetical protein
MAAVRKQLKNQVAAVRKQLNLLGGASCADANGVDIQWSEDAQWMLDKLCTGEYKGAPQAYKARRKSKESQSDAVDSATSSSDVKGPAVATPASSSATGALGGSSATSPAAAAAKRAADSMEVDHEVSASGVAIGTSGVESPAVATPASSSATGALGGGTAPRHAAVATDRGDGTMAETAASSAAEDVVMNLRFQYSNTTQTFDLKIRSLDRIDAIKEEVAHLFVLSRDSVLLFSEDFDREFDWGKKWADYHVSEGDIVAVLGYAGSAMQCKIQQVMSECLSYDDGDVSPELADHLIGSNAGGNDKKMLVKVWSESNSDDFRHWVTRAIVLQAMLNHNDLLANPNHKELAEATRIERVVKTYSRYTRYKCEPI